MAYDELQRDPPELIADFIEAHRHGVLGPSILPGMVPKPRGAAGPIGLRSWPMC